MHYQDTSELFETLREELGSDELLEELARALTDNVLGSCLEYIARNWDIEA